MTLGDLGGWEFYLMPAGSEDSALQRSEPEHKGGNLYLSISAYLVPLVCEGSRAGRRTRKSPGAGARAPLLAQSVILGHGFFLFILIYKHRSLCYFIVTGLDIKHERC